MELSNAMMVELAAPEDEEVVVAVAMVTGKIFPEDALSLCLISIAAPIFFSSALLISSL